MRITDVNVEIFKILRTFHFFKTLINIEHLYFFISFKNLFLEISHYFYFLLNFIFIFYFIYFFLVF